MKTTKIKEQIKICAELTNLLCSRCNMQERVNIQKYSDLKKLILSTDFSAAEELEAAVKTLFVRNTLQKNVFSLGRICAVINILSKKYENASERHKIFISHSSKDKDIMEIFVEKILRLGCGIESKDIFYTSIEDMGIRNGDDIRKHIKESMLLSACVFLMISTNYVQSGMCLNEMGASWALDKNVKPFLFSEVKHNTIWLSEVLRNSYLHESATLDALRDDLNNEFELEPRSTSDWNKQKNDFLDYLTGYTT